MVKLSFDSQARPGNRKNSQRFHSHTLETSEGLLVKVGRNSNEA